MKELKTEKRTYQRPTIRLESLQHPNYLLTTSGEGMVKRNSYEATDENPFGSYGNITIASTVTRITAIKDSLATFSIGIFGNNFHSCGGVTIGGTVYYNGDSFQNGGD
jgi:hypothetical protein